MPMTATYKTGSNVPIGILVKTFPKLSETFILNELQALKSQGVAFEVIALKRPAETVTHPGVAALMPHVTYISRKTRLQTGLAIAAAHVQRCLRSPWRYLQALGAALRRSESGGLQDFVFAVPVSQIVKGLNLRHLYTHFINQPAGIAELVKRVTGVPFSLSAHAKDIYLSAPDSLRRKLQAARFTVTCTDANRTYLHEVAGPGANVVLMYHGIDTDRFKPDDRTAGVGRPDVPVILSVGRLREKKGFPVLIDACHQLRNQGVAFKCQIVGYGPEQERLQALIERLALVEHVELVGKLSNSEVIARYRTAALFVLPCQIANDGDRDGIPNVMLEAMAMQLPVVSTAVSGIPEVLRDGDNGLMVEPGDAGQLAGAMRSLLRNSLLAAQLGMAGRKTVIEMFSAQANIRKLCELLADEPNARRRALNLAGNVRKKQWATH